MTKIKAMPERDIIDRLADLMLTPKEIRAELRATAHLYLIEVTDSRWRPEPRYTRDPADFRNKLHTRLHVSIMNRKFVKKFRRKHEVDKIVGQTVSAYKKAKKDADKADKIDQKRRQRDAKMGRYGS
jgi:hypothetical protein